MPLSDAQMDAMVVSNQKQAPLSDEQMDSLVHGSSDKPNESWLDTSILGHTPRNVIQDGLNALPTIGMVGGGLAGAETGPGAVVTAGLGGAAGSALKNLGEQYILGQDKTRSDIYGDPARAGIESAGAEMGGKLIGKGLQAAAETPAGQYVLNKAGQAFSKLKNFAEDAAVNATGATGKQASNFAPNAGRELLDRGIVRFGDSQKQIAQRASEAVDQANQQIDQALTHLQSKGVKVDANTIYNTVRNTIEEMKADPSKADIANNLESELNNLIKSTDARGTTKIPIQEAEAIKRGYSRKAGNWADPEKGQAGKEMYQTFRGAVEDAGQAADPATTQAFQQGKQSYGLLTPIQEAAERRASTTNQHQPGGFLDITGALLGEAAGGPAMAIAAPLARRMIAPRIGSSVAVGVDTLANALSSTGKVAEGFASNAPGLVGQGVQNMIPQAPSIPQAASTGSPDKGPDKWANDGFQKLKNHVGDEDRKLLEDNKGSIMLDPKTKKLLVTASSFSPGSKPLNDILKHIKDRLGDK